VVNSKAILAAFIVLTVIFGATSGYLLANPVAVDHTLTATQFSTSTSVSTVTTTSVPPAVTSSITGTVTATQSLTVVRVMNFTTTSTVTSISAVVSGFSVNIAYKAGLGFYLVNGNGTTLYFRTLDDHNNGTSTCTDVCVDVWPVFYTSHLTVAPGLNASAFTIVTRSDGKQQIDYNGWPLYYYAQDKGPGDTAGQGIGGVWFVYSLPVPSQFTTSTTTTTSSTAMTTSTTSTSTHSTYSY